MASNRSQTEAARAKAQEKFAQSEQRQREAASDRQKAFVAVVAKTRRLRALRLAREEAERQTQASAAKPQKIR